MGDTQNRGGQEPRPSHLWPFQIRRSMIDGNKGHKQIRTLLKSLDEVRAGGAESQGRPPPPADPSPACWPQYLTQPLLPEVHRRGDAQLHLGAYKEHQLQVSGAKAGRARRGLPLSRAQSRSPLPPPPSPTPVCQIPVGHQQPGLLSSHPMTLSAQGPLTSPSGTSTIAWERRTDTRQYL